MKCIIKSVVIAMSLGLAFVSCAEDKHNIANHSEIKIAHAAALNDTQTFDKLIFSAENFYLVCPATDLTPAIQDRLKIVFNYYNDKALQGDSDAQRKVGMAYVFEVGINKADLKLAKLWLLKSANQGNLKAQTDLALLYSMTLIDDLPRELSYKKAFDLYKKSAKQGDARAQAYLATFYTLGRGTRKNFAKALYWARKSAEQKYPVSLSLLAGFYFDGDVIEKDYKKSFDLYMEALTLGDLSPSVKIRTIRAIEYLYENGFGTKKDLKKALYWKNKREEYKKMVQSCVRKPSQ